MVSIRRVYVVLLLVYCASSWSEVTLDGSIGSAGALTGPDYQITENLGQRAGSNLFHSFGQFNLETAESATFSGNPAIQNVISRVTGGSPSSIDGTLRSTIPNANLYFLNPAGVFFGPNASLDVQGSFHVSTADYLGLKDGTRFVANLLSDNQVLTTATPKTFGFLGDNPSAITLAQTELEVPNGESLSVIGGDIDLESGQLIAPAGRIDLASVSSKGEVVRQNNNLSLNGFEQLGKIELTQSAKMDTSGEGGGAIFIRGGELSLNESEIRSDTLGAGVGRDVDIRLPQGTLELRNGGVVRVVTKGAGKSGDLFIESRNISLSRNGSEIITSLLSGSTSSGDGGDIKVKTESLELVNGAAISSIATDTSTGNGGDVEIKTESLEIVSGGSIFSLALGDGSSGDVFIEADSFRLSGEGIDGPARVSASTESSGNAGDLTIQSNSLDLNVGATIFTSTRGSGSGGNVLLEANSVRIAGEGADSRTVISTSTDSNGNAGDLTIQANSLDVDAGAMISTTTDGFGNGGVVLIEGKKVSMTGSKSSISALSLNKGNSQNITIKTDSLEVSDGASINTFVTDGTTGMGAGKTANLLIEAKDIVLDGNQFESFTGILGGSFNSNNAGKVILITENLVIRNGAQVNTSASSIGNGGDILVTARNILLSDEFSGFQSSATRESRGNAGKINIQADNFELRDRAGISTSTLGTGNGGDLLVTARNIVINDGVLSSSFFGSSGDESNAGNVTLSTENLELRKRATVSTSTTGSGNGGDLLVTAENIVLSDSSLLADTIGDSSGNAGKVIINTDNLELRDGSAISTSTLGTGTGGDLLVTAENILLSDGATLNAFTGIGDSGDAGKIDITTNNLEVRKGSTLATFTAGLGDGGDVIVKAGNLLLSGDGATEFTGMLGGTGDTGDAGDVTIVATHLDIRDGAMIETNTNDAGKGGNISIESRSVLLSGDGSNRNTGLFSRSRDVGDNAGDAGKISITANDSLRILDRSFVLVDTTNANGGDIIISADHLFQLRDSEISTSVADGKGNGGNIFIGQQPDSESTALIPNVTALNNSKIVAQANEGNGGEINITSDFVFISENSIVDATSSEGGIDGTVNVNSPETNISGSIVALPENYINASEHLSERCAARSANISSFVVKDRSTVPTGPDDAAASIFFENDLPQRLSANTMANSDQIVVSQQRETESTDLHILSTNPDYNTGLFLAEVGCGK